MTMLKMKWISRIRTHSSSSSESIDFPTPPSDHLNPIEFEQLYISAKEEIKYAQESQGTIYYEGDQQTASDALAACEQKYDMILQQCQNDFMLNNFKLKWEAELFQLRISLNALPLN